MKKIIMLLCVVASFLFFNGIQKSYAVLKQAPPVSAVKPEAIAKQAPPDLAVSVKFVHIETWTRDDGTKCYSPRPYFTITNRGQSDANDFDYIIEWKLDLEETEKKKIIIEYVVEHPRDVEVVGLSDE